MRWAKKEGIADSLLIKGIEEFEQGLFDASLGQHLYKKRIPLSGKGKRGGARTILFYQEKQKMIFCFGFAKNVKDNLGAEDKIILKRMSVDFIKLGQEEISDLMKQKKFFEIKKEILA